MSTTLTTSSVTFPKSTRADLGRLRIPDLDTLDQELPVASTSSPVAAAAVPFPRISQRRKLVRGVGTQPWHKRASDSDSEEESPSTIPKSTTRTMNIATPSPQLMPGADPKRTYSESQIQGTTAPVTPMLTVYTTPLIRKKSGEVVKPSLKSPSVSSFGSGSATSGSGSVRGSPRPPTPIFEKSVHFDGQLERVKIFFKEQKPAAVSREGSPYGSETSDNDTVGVNSDINNYRSSEEERVRSRLVLDAVNIPLRNAMASTQERLGDLDVRLEQVKLSQDGRNVEGTVLVRNIAFEKWVSVRFTYDFWQTTSEVTAKYSSSFPEENTDLFSFSIRLPDVTRRIEEKRLFFALRYNVAEREAWDNNKGENYQIRFKVETKQREQEKNKKQSKFPPSWPVKTANVDQMADLRKELERVVREDEESSGVQAWDVLTAKLRAKNISIEEDLEAQKKVQESTTTLNLKSRYDFGASSKVKWEPPKELPKYGGPPPETANIPFPSSRATHVKSASHTGVTSPLQQLNTGSWRSPRGSPRDHGTDSTPHSPKFFIDPKDAKHWGGQAQPQQQQSQQAQRNSRQRNHQRGGYFDSWLEGSKCVLTPTTPVQEESASAVDMCASSSIDSVATVTPGQVATTSPASSSPSVVVVNDEVSESESTDSTSSSSANGTSPDTAETSASIGLGVEQARAIRFNSYPMDRTYIAAATSAPQTPDAVAAPANTTTTLAVPQPWGPSATVISPQGSTSSVSSTPSFTSASSPSQCPSSPSELSDSLRAMKGGSNRPTVDSLDYGYFLRKFCYFTGHDIEDRHNVNNAYGSTFHRHSISDSTMDGHAANWQPGPPPLIKRPAFITRVSSQDESSWSGESGHTTPTRGTTPRANSPIVVSSSNDTNEFEATPRISETFVRPYRGSSF